MKSTLNFLYLSTYYCFVRFKNIYKTQALKHKIHLKLFYEEKKSFIKITTFVIMTR